MKINKCKKIYQYSEEDGNGKIIWINYNPKKYNPQSDTRIIKENK